MEGRLENAAASNGKASPLTLLIVKEEVVMTSAST